MISLPCTPSLPKSPIFFKTGPTIIFNHPPRRPIWKFRSREFAAPWKNFFAAMSSSDFGDSSDQRIRTLFPGGFKRPEIKVPTLVLKLTSEEVLESMDCLNVVDSAVSKWAGIVLLDSGEESGGKLYEAARALKSVIRDRAYFLISERVDIAAAVGSSGVVLSDKGIPTIVARNMMSESKPDSVLLPLVARTVQTENSAIFASSSEGADFIILSIEGETYPEELVKSVSQNVKVPIFAMVGLIGEGPLLTSASNLLQTGANGLVVSLESMKLLSDDILSKLLSSSHVANKRKLDAFQSSDKLGDMDREFHERKRKVGSTVLEEKTRMFIEAERLVLLEVVAIIRKAAPLMEEISLLIDAVSRLDDPFLLVIVGEFNSGKSTVINALLGKRYLKEGVVPTTNEITLLCYSEMDANQQERCERHPDGQFICYLPAPILKEMNLVDTPGTNVILQRQQRLTEEFVPRADLILFVISADRPLTESEVAFLRYIQQWKKKVVFVLNKSDIYQNKSELEEAVAFIKENTQKLLNTESVTLYPVSARHALEAKLLVSSVGKSFEELQLSDPGWMTSGFYELEKFLFSFLDGSTDTGIERIQLKLETPIGIAVRLLSRCESLVRKESEQANHDLITIEVIISSLKDYAMKMESESSYWRKQTLSLIEAAKVRAVKLAESTLQLSNLDLVAKYFFDGEKSISVSPTSRIENEIINPTLLDVHRLLGEYQEWLQSSNAHEGKRYKESFTERLPTVVNAEKTLPLESHELLRRGEEHSLKVLENFSASAAAKLFEQEIREVVIGTFGGLGAAGLSASLLTSVLPTTVEDLLALGVCSAGGLFAISKFPARRKEVTDKVSKVADSLAREFEEAMQKDLSQTMENLRHSVETYSRPYQDAAQHRLNYLLAIQEELSNVGSKLRALQTELQNLHVHSSSPK